MAHALEHRVLLLVHLGQLLQNPSFTLLEQVRALNFFSNQVIFFVEGAAIEGRHTVPIASCDAFKGIFNLGRCQLVKFVRARLLLFQLPELTFLLLLPFNLAPLPHNLRLGLALL